MLKSTLWLRAALVDDDTEATPGTPEEYTAFIDKDEIKWSRIVQASGAKNE
jgi:hypothetical protein